MARSRSVGSPQRAVCENAKSQIKEAPPGSSEPGGLFVSTAAEIAGLLRQRIRTQLPLHQLRYIALADAFAMEWRAVAGAGPYAAAFPAAVRVVDAAVKGLGVEAHRIGYHEVDHLAVLERDQRLVLVAGGERRVIAEPQRVVLIDPGVVARFRRAVARIDQHN